MAAAWSAVGILLLLVMAEPLVKTLLSTTKVVVRNLPGVPPVPKARFSPAEGEATLCGVFVETDDSSGRAVRVSPVRVGGRLAQAVPD